VPLLFIITVKSASNIYSHFRKVVGGTPTVKHGTFTTPANVTDVFWQQLCTYTSSFNDIRGFVREQKESLRLMVSWLVN